MYDRMRNVGFDFEYDEIPDLDNESDDAFETCPECKGHGYDSDEQDNEGRSIMHKCPTCKGVGTVPSNDE